MRYNRNISTTIIMLSGISYTDIYNGSKKRMVLHILTQFAAGHITNLALRILKQL